MGYTALSDVYRRKISEFFPQDYADIKVTAILIPGLRKQNGFYYLVARLSSHSNTDELE